MAANVLTLQPLDATRGFTVTTALVPVPLVGPDAVGAEDAIEPMLAFIWAASGGQLLNMHLQVAQSPLVLDQYTALRRAIGTLATLDALPRVAVAVGAVEQDAPLPVIRFTRRRRQVRARLTRLGPFWLAEAAGRRLRVHVDDGRVAITAKSRRPPEPVPTRRSTSRLNTPFLPAQEIS
jgi:hypothetical protein